MSSACSSIIHTYSHACNGDACEYGCDARICGWKCALRFSPGRPGVLTCATAASRALDVYLFVECEMAAVELIDHEDYCISTTDQASDQN
jgi:hypothetical protein